MNHKAHQILAGVTCVLGMTMTAHAASSPFYIGMTLGATRTGSIVSGADMTTRSGAVAGLTLGYRVNEHFGVEGFYTGAGRFDAHVGAGQGSGKVDVIGVDAIGWLPVADRVSLFAKLGLARSRTTANFSDVSLGASNRNALTYGLGMQYSLSSKLELRAAWDRYGAAIVTAGGRSDFNADVYSLGLFYRFH